MLIGEIMTEEERQDFVKAWQEAENMITMIDPEFKKLGGSIKSPVEATATDILTLLRFLRVEIRSMLHDNESMVREKQGLYTFIQENGQGDALDKGLGG